MPVRLSSTIRATVSTHGGIAWATALFVHLVLIAFNGTTTELRGPLGGWRDLLELDEKSPRHVIEVRMSEYEVCEDLIMELSSAIYHPRGYERRRVPRVPTNIAAPVVPTRSWGPTPNVGVGAMYRVPTFDALTVYEELGLPEPFVMTSPIEAIDQLKQELSRHAADGELEVLWLVDRTASMQADRKHLGHTLETTLKELQRSQSASHTVAEFGAEFNLLTPEPANSARAFADAWQATTDDGMGLERCTTAVIELLRTIGK